MGKARFTEEQIAYSLRQADTGTAVAEVIRKMGASGRRFYRRKVFEAFARSGGVMTYGLNLWKSFRILARSVDRFLKGAKPAELPVEQPTKFELVVNLQTTRARHRHPAINPRPHR